MISSNNNRQAALEDLIRELVYLITEVHLPRCDYHRRAAEARAKAEALLAPHDSLADAGRGHDV